MPIVTDDLDNDEEPRESRDLPSMISGGAAAIAGIRLGPEAALAFGTLAYKFEPMVEKALAELRPDTRRRAAQMLSAAAEKAGCDAEELDGMIVKSDRSRLMTGLAIAAAERTTWPPQVVALGRLLADGLIAEGDAVDVVQYALDAMSEMGRLHVSLLDLLVRYEPDQVAGRETRAVPHRVPSYVPLTFAPPPDAETFWSVGRRTWKAVQIPIVRPELGPVLTGLAGSLIRHGLAEQTDRTREAMEQLGKDFQSRIDQLGSEIRLRAPKVERIERSWAPTELGEKVLEYYLQAGAEADLAAHPPVST